ncbi:MAG: hypothetical protein CR972_05365 [Candidatus Moraniibacteriota bacterium]|nr:MAG: hypothetical protein CR972_05365 [Candidatus Moranbacteria bacterium]
MTEEGFVSSIMDLCRIREPEAKILLQKLRAIDPNKEEQEKQKNRYKKMTLNEAIQKYPGVLQQNVTQNPIIAKPFLQPLKPTVKNWIMVYEKNTDVRKHDDIERGTFLFRAEATKYLSQKERNDLSYVLTSRDEDVKISIDIQAQHIVFPQTINRKTMVSQQSQKTPIVKSQHTSQKKEEKPTPQSTAVQKSQKIHTAQQKLTLHKKQKEDDFAQKEAVLRDVTAELAYFSKNMQKRDSMVVSPKAVQENAPIQITAKDHAKIDREMGKKPHSLKNNKRGLSTRNPVKTATVKDMIAREKQEEIQKKIQKEQEELRQKTDKINAVIRDMQQNIDVPRNIGEGVEKVTVVGVSDQHGTMEDEIYKNRTDLYGSIHTHTKKELPKKTAVKQDATSVSNAVDTLPTTPMEKTQVHSKQQPTQKTPQPTQNMTFTSNHVLPVEQEKTEENKKINRFTITPIGEKHSMEE